MGAESQDRKYDPEPVGSSYCMESAVLAKLSSESKDNIQNYIEKMLPIWKSQLKQNVVGYVVDIDPRRPTFRAYPVTLTSFGALFAVDWKEKSVTEWAVDKSAANLVLF